MNNDYYDTYGNDAYATQDDPNADNSTAYQQPNTGAVDGALPNGMSNAQMTGLLIASGVPFGKAMLATSQMQQQQNARALQSYRFQIAQQKLLDKQNQTQSANDAFNQLLEGSPSNAAVNPNTPTATPANPNLPAANTLADMNANTDQSDDPDANDAVDPNNPYATPSGVTMSQATGNSGITPVPTGTAPFPGTGLTQEIKDQARLMWKTGDKKGAVKLINDARAQGAGNGFVKSTMVSAGRGTLGSNFTNPQTGETVSINTNQNTSVDQRAVGALQRVHDQVGRLLQVYPQFQDYWQGKKADVQGVANQYLHGDYKLPSQRAEGEAILDQIPEALVKAFNIDPTIPALNDLKASFSPVPGESAKGYTDRINRNLAELDQFGNQAQLRLSGGTIVSLGKGSGSNPNVSGSNNTMPSMPSGQQTAQPSLSTGSPYNQQQLMQQAQAAIARGADPKAVQARIMKLIGGSQ